MKTHWKGMLSFGLVNIPVSLFSATRKKNISFNQLRKSDYSRVRYKKVAGNDGEEVHQSEIVKGYEVSPDNYVIVEDAELAGIAPEASRIISINEFVRAEEIDTRHFDASYYLAPTESGLGKAYALLLEAMSKAGVVGIAKFVLRSREYLAAIRPIGNALVLTTMLFADEIISTKELEELLPGEIDLPKKEVDIASQLINSLIVEFDPVKYENQYYKQMMQIIKKKAASNVVHEPVNNSGMVVDLMAALEASLAQMKQIEKPKKKTKKKA